jgi:RNA polymerase sigma factor (sigma-70 family)
MAESVFGPDLRRPRGLRRAELHVRASPYFGRAKALGGRLFPSPGYGQTAFSLAERPLGRLTSPTRAARRAEMQVRLQDVLNTMDPVDGEVLTLRHFEELSNGETARVLGLTKSAASNRYMRALIRLKETRAGSPGFLETT